MGRSLPAFRLQALFVSAKEGAGAPSDRYRDAR